MDENTTFYNVIILLRSISFAMLFFGVAWYCITSNRQSTGNTFFSFACILLGVLNTIVGYLWWVDKF